jgi:uncharacterized protein (DUF952 family)
MHTAQRPFYVYKIVAEATWQAAVAKGQYSGSPDDIRDGYIHFSTAAQTAGTLAKHFAGQPSLVIIAVESTKLGPALRWEPSRGGALFPHLYGPLPVAAAAWVRPLSLTAAGTHHIPPEVS